ncbi:MAG: hypothetical protein ABI624_23845 [Casimicrobiaceae bacterium]
MSGDVFTNWTDEVTASWGKRPVKTTHGLHTSPLLSLEAIAELIDRFPREQYSLVSRSEVDGKRFQHEGDFGALTGKQVLDWIAAGHLWLNLRHVPLVDKRYGDLLGEAYDEMARRAPGARMFNASLGILISSPHAGATYHCDLPGQALWQIHGRKRIYIYPPEPPFLRVNHLEDIALFGIEEELPYEAGYDASATVVELEPGAMAHWPLNAPHRVENHGMLNISVATEHWADDIERLHKVNLANGILRNRFGWTPRSRAVSGPGYQAKVVLQGVMRRMNWVKKTRAERRPLAFRLDGTRPGAIAAVAAPLRETAPAA